MNDNNGNNNIKLFRQATPTPDPVDEVLDCARGKLDSIIILGWDKDEDSYISHTKQKKSDILLLLEIARQNIIGDLT